MIAVLSSNGEVFTFTLPSPAEYEASGKGKQRAAVQPQRVWALRKQFSAVKVCTDDVYYSLQIQFTIYMRIRIRTLPLALMARSLYALNLDTSLFVRGISNPDRAAPAIQARRSSSSASHISNVSSVFAQILLALMGCCGSTISRRAYK